ncbi:MAG: helix-turn-helix domain-containing protein [Pseudonocardia sp.]
MRIPPPLPVGAADAAVLRSWAAGAEATSRRARIVLLAGEGLGSTEIARRLGCSKQTVVTWRERFRADGVDGLRDAPRSGRPATVDEAAVLARTFSVPPGAPPGRWSTRSLAADLGISNAAVGAIWRARAIRPAARGGVRFGTEPVLDATLDAVLGVHVGGSGCVLALLVSASHVAWPGGGGTGPAARNGTGSPGVPFGSRPDVHAALAAAAARACGAAADDPAGFLARLPAPGPGARIALLATSPGDVARRWAGARSAARVHLVPPDREWADVAATVCAVVAATPHGAATVTALARAVSTSPSGASLTWRAD